ncbi:MAG: hypothetical protein RQ982_05385, partial [Gammaproteobacteria bacterium]|nr:hypothetical protein [Gammaproteobacteria bacterium]
MIIRNVTRFIVSGFMLCGFMLPAVSVYAEQEDNGVYVQTVNKPIVEVYDKVYKSLEDGRFFVVFEPDIGANLSNFAEK